MCGSTGHRRGAVTPLWTTTAKGSSRLGLPLGVEVWGQEGPGRGLQRQRGGCRGWELLVALLITYMFWALAELPHVILPALPCGCHYPLQAQEKSTEAHRGQIIGWLGPWYPRSLSVLPFSCSGAGGNQGHAQGGTVTRLPDGSYLHCPPAHFIDGGLEDSMGQALAKSTQLKARTCLSPGKARRSRARRPGEEGPSAGGHAASGLQQILSWRPRPQPPP